MRVVLNVIATFGPADNEIVLDQPQNCVGLMGRVLEWFRPYLSDHGNYIKQ